MARSPSPKARSRMTSVKNQDVNDPPPPANNNEEKDHPVLRGVTLDDQIRFRVPPTPTALEALAFWYSLPSLTTMMFSLMTMYFALPIHSPWIIIALSLFWRFAYDFGLGYILHQQSKTQFLTNWVKSVQASILG